MLTKQMFICAPLGLLFIDSDLEQPCRDQRVSALRCCESWKKNLQKIESPSLLQRRAVVPWLATGTRVALVRRGGKSFNGDGTYLSQRAFVDWYVPRCCRGRCLASQGCCCCQAAQPCGLDGLCLFWMIFRQKLRDDSSMENVVFKIQVDVCVYLLKYFNQRRYQMCLFLNYLYYVFCIIAL